MEKAYRFLRKVFSDKRLVDDFIEKSEFLEIPAHTRILDQGKYVKIIPFVYEGMINVMRKGDEGKDVLLYYINPGESCALSIVAGLTRTKSVAYAETEVASKIFALPVDTVAYLHSQYSQCNDFFLELFRNRFKEIVCFIDSVAFKTMDVRIIQHLKKKQKQFGTNTIHITHQQLANELGSAREVVSRLLKQLERDGKITLRHSTIEIIQPL